ncbi:MAG: hypothetical protein AUI17_01550 [Acidobacteriales bacterium 13_2_20CM_2_55_5]|nr:MAG: hypothetical protein AUI17_01550 [Acidobacteriales bacterium 13_2_20CM_2_55_5]
MTKFEDKTAVDFVIVGAGGAGGVVAKELSTAGFQVVVLEQGPYLHEGDFIHDELKFKDVFDPPFIGQEVLTNDHTLQPNTFRKTAPDKAVLTSFAQYGRCVGGGTVHFTGNYWRFHEVDFLERSRPIRYHRCPLSLPASCWSAGHANLDGMPIRRRLRYCPSLTADVRRVPTAVSVNSLAVNGAPNQARWRL